MRQLFFDNINGVIFVYDLSNPASSYAELKEWANEILAHGSFVAPLPIDTISYQFEDLPIPTLVIGNKSDISILGSSSSMSILCKLILCFNSSVKWFVLDGLIGGLALFLVALLC